jgi:hypothetical protein
MKKNLISGTLGHSSHRLTPKKALKECCTELQICAVGVILRRIPKCLHSRLHIVARLLELDGGLAPELLVSAPGRSTIVLTKANLIVDDAAQHSSLAHYLADV